MVEQSQQNRVVARDNCDNIKPQPTNLYTWQQVAEKNSEKETWIIVRDKVYDVTEWLYRHPGGKEMLLLHAGRDCTYAFDSYHPFSDKSVQTLQKFEIGCVVGGTEFPAYLPDSGFYKECKRRVAVHFTSNQQHPKHCLRGMTQMLLVFPVGLLSYLLMSGWLSSNIFFLLTFSVLHGCCVAIPLMHLDSSHGAITRYHKVWELVGRLTMDWLTGLSFTSWNNQHIVGHHIYTNVAGVDPDLPVNFKNDVRRIVRRQILKPIYNWQHFYLPPLYGFLSMKFRIQDFTHTFFTQTNGAVRVNPLNIIDWILLISSKLFWMFHRIWIPLYVLQAPQFWLTFVLSEFVTGLYLAFNFQVSHISPSCKYQCDDKDSSHIQEEWAISQIKSSVDYAHGSQLVAFLSGGLNYQATHHLFPTVSQYYLPQISPIVQEVCREFGIDYMVLPSFFDAFKAHLVYLKVMGRNGKRVDVHMG